MLNILRITDWVIIVLLIQFLYSGWNRGLFRSSIGLIALSLCSILGILYFDLTQNIIISLTIVFSGTVLVTIILLFMHAVGRASVEKEYRGYTLKISRFMGSIVSVFWQGNITIIVLIIISLMPIKFFGLDLVQRDIHASKTYLLISEHVISKVPFIHNVINIVSLFKNPDNLQSLSQTKEFQNFFLNDKIADLLSDEHLMQLIDNKQFHHFISNPKVNKIIHDSELMKNLTDLSKRIYQYQNKPLFVKPSPE